MKTAKDYAETVSPEVYISGIRVHIWLATMYELMIQLVLKEIDTLLGKQENVILYDLGCGPGHFLHTLANRLTAPYYHYKVLLVGIDNSTDFIEYAFKTDQQRNDRERQFINFIPADVLDFAAKQGDIVTMSGFLHHFPPQEKGRVLQKVNALLKKGGLFIEGDEHVAPVDWFESRFGKLGTKMAICALYFQVISAANRCGHKELTEAEIENCVAELYRDDPEGFPLVGRERLMKSVTNAANRFMKDLARKGLQRACEGAFTEISFLDRARAKNGDNNMFDRGDFKITVGEAVNLARSYDLALNDIHDTGQNEILGSAPVLTFRKA